MTGRLVAPSRARKTLASMDLVLVQVGQALARRLLV
jgi:hypothetical protein